jgi:hypothetical protein
MLAAPRAHAIGAGSRLPRSSVDIEGGDTMKSKLFIGTLALGAAALVAGCVAHAQAGGYVEGDAPVVFSGEPTLVVVEPDVWVVRDYDYAVYYVDGYYWVYRGDVWHRSPTYDSGWTTVEVNVVPRVIVSRDHHTYVHYVGAANAQTRKAPRAAGAPNDRDRSQHADDKAPRPPERADERREGPPAPGVNPRDGKAQNEGKRDNVKEEKKADDKKQPGKKDDKKEGHGKK